MDVLRFEQKIVINTRFGGYGLSKAASEAIARRKGVTLVNLGNEKHPYYEYTEDGVTKDFFDLPRNDSDLVAVVEELGDAANGPTAQLAVKTVTVHVSIDDYDGKESISVY